MKPQFTTSGSAFIEQVQAGLIAPGSPECAWIFASFPAFGTDSFAIQFLAGDSPVLLVRKWNPTTRSAFPLGVHLYDLNQITYNERTITLSEQDLPWIAKIVESDWTVKKSDGIMLDGVEYVFISGENNIRWKFIDSLSPGLEEVLDRLCRLAGVLR